MLSVDTNSLIHFPRRSSKICDLKFAENYSIDSGHHTYVVQCGVLWQVCKHRIWYPVLVPARSEYRNRFTDRPNPTSSSALSISVSLSRVTPVFDTTVNCQCHINTL